MHLKQSRNPLAAYAELPYGVRFGDQRQGERVVLLLRQHLIVNLKWALALVAATLLPPFVYWLPWTDWLGLEGMRALPIEVRETMILVWYTGVIGFVIEAFFVWYYSVYLVTNKRVVDTDFRGLLHYSSNEASLSKIQNVSHEQGGVWQLLFNYGTVKIKTGASGIYDGATLTFDNVPQPARVADLLTDILPRTKNPHYKRVLDKGERATVMAPDGLDVTTYELDNTEQLSFEPLVEEEPDLTTSEYTVQAKTNRQRYRI